MYNFIHKYIDKQKRFEYNKRYRIKHRKSIRTLSKKRQKKIWHDNPKLAKQKQHQYNYATRKRTIISYGGKCICCGETNIKFLSFHHIYGGGRKERLKLGSKFYSLLRKKFRKDIKIMCYNCNLANGFYKICPHKLEKLNLT